VEYVAKMSTGMLKPYNVTAVISGTIQSVQTYHHIFTKHFVLFLDVFAVISIDASWKFLMLTAWLSGGGLEMLIGMTAGLSFKVLIGLTGGLSLKVLNLFVVLRNRK
jgi:hypothetical protein